MSTEPLHEPTRVRVTKSVLIALAIIGSAIAAFLLAIYLYEALNGGVPLVNVFLSIVLCSVGFLLSGLSFHSRGSWREVAILSLAFFAAALADFRFGPIGFLWVFTALYLVHRILGLREKLRQREADEA